MKTKPGEQETLIAISCWVGIAIGVAIGLTSGEAPWWTVLLVGSFMCAVAGGWTWLAVKRRAGR